MALSPPRTTMRSMRSIPTSIPRPYLSIRPHRRLFHCSRILFNPSHQGLSSHQDINTQQPQPQELIRIREGTFHCSYPSPGSPAASSSNPALFPNLHFSLLAYSPKHNGNNKDDDGHSSTSTNTRTTSAAAGAAQAATGTSAQIGASLPQTWGIISSSSLTRTTFLQILSSQHFCSPPTARSYPYLSSLSLSPSSSIRYIGFDAERGNNVSGTSLRGSYLSARYESRREITDFTVTEYLLDLMELNSERMEASQDERMRMEGIGEMLNLGGLMRMPVANLSNGQTRRVRIAKALMDMPRVLLLDGPFMGLDPGSVRRMREVLGQLARREEMRLVVSLREGESVPEWVTNVVVGGGSPEMGVLFCGSREEFERWDGVGYGDYQRGGEGAEGVEEASGSGAHAHKHTADGFTLHTPSPKMGEALVEMQGVKVTYNNTQTVLGDWSQTDDQGEMREGLWWSLHRGQRCGIFGANGSGKTTMLSLITSDHPQTYSLPIKLFGRSRLPEAGQPGISVFDLQRRMGHCSPEVHAFFPKTMSLRRVLESAWADAPLAKAMLDKKAEQRIDAVLRWFARDLNPQMEGMTRLESLSQRCDTPRDRWARNDVEQIRTAIRGMYDSDNNDNPPDLDWATSLRFSEISFAAQRLLLFLRAIIASPDLVILDEALSGVDEKTRDKALLFLAHGETYTQAGDGGMEKSLLAEVGGVKFAGLTDEQALLVISHAKEDVPGCVREWICLPEPGEGKPPRVGVLPGPLALVEDGWRRIWGEVDGDAA